MRNDKVQDFGEADDREAPAPASDTTKQPADLAMLKRLTALEGEITYLRRAVGEIDKAVTTLLRQSPQR